MPPLLYSVIASRILDSSLRHSFHLKRLSLTTIFHTTLSLSFPLKPPPSCFVTLSSLILRLGDFIKASLSYCKQLGFSTAQWPKIAHLISKSLHIVIISCISQANDPKSLIANVSHISSFNPFSFFFNCFIYIPNAASIPGPPPRVLYPIPPPLCL